MNGQLYDTYRYVTKELQMFHQLHAQFRLTIVWRFDDFGEEIQNRFTGHFYEKTIRTVAFLSK